MERKFETFDIGDTVSMVREPGKYFIIDKTDSVFMDIVSNKRIVLSERIELPKEIRRGISRHESRKLISTKNLLTERIRV